MKSNLAGKTVLSLSGHDKGLYFLVVYDDGRYVYIADGKTRKLEKTKRKNRKHISLVSVSDICDTGNMTNRYLRRYLKEAAERFESIIKE